jgi:predicted nucleic acid-binding protein
VTSLVLDCSVAVAWCFEDEATAELDALLVAVRGDGASVPALWHLEIANVLLMAERCGRITAAGATRSLHLLSTLPISTDLTEPERVRRDIVPLARAHRLTLYDAAYFELAVRTGVPLATADRALARAARTAGIAVLPG